ncbi:dorsalin-1-like [Periplaneta americana]|uniref:dorsalin-1-like n=1 Tax=Periplaneta americana TaxID=6978 RepID=UPI0037E8F9E1
MSWPNSVALLLMSLLFCTWLWVSQLPHINSQDMITTNVEVSLRGETVAPSVIANNSAKSVVQTTSKVHENKDVHKHKQRHSVPQFMLDLFERATAAKQNNPSDSGTFIPDVVRGLTPRTTASVSERDSALVLLSGDRRHLLEFDVPSSSYGEVLQSAELRLLITSVQRQSNHDAGKKTGVERLVHVYLLDEKSSMLELDVQHVFHQQGDRWLSFNVTTAMRRAKPRTLLRILVSIRTTTLRNQQDLALVVHPHGGRQFQDVQPLLLLSYSAYMASSPGGKRGKRDAEDYEEESNNVWDDDRAPAGIAAQARRARRQRNTCRRRPLYVDFSEIHYDTWIVAPSGYEAFQCTGKCFFPVSEHLSPTKHAIVQTLLHSVAPGKVPRACCVPTRLEPISVLYVDHKGVLTYRFSYQDMVVAECGCR